MKIMTKKDSAFLPLRTEFAQFHDPNHLANLLSKSGDVIGSVRGLDGNIVYRYSKIKFTSIQGLMNYTTKNLHCLINFLFVNDLIDMVKTKTQKGQDFFTYIINNPISAEEVKQVTINVRATELGIDKWTVEYEAELLQLVEEFKSYNNYICLSKVLTINRYIKKYEVEDILDGDIVSTNKFVRWCTKNGLFSQSTRGYRKTDKLTHMLHILNKQCEDE